MSFCNFCTGSNALLKCGNPALHFHSIRTFYGFSIFEKIRGTGWIDGQTDGQTDERGATLNAAHKGGGAAQRDISFKDICPGTIQHTT